MDARILDVTQDDLIRAARLHALIRMVGRRGLRLTAVAALFMTALPLLNGVPLGFTLAHSTVYALLVVPGYLLLFWVITPPAARRQLEQNIGLRGPFRLTWDATVYSAEAPTVHWRTPWKHYVRWAESGSMLLMFHSDTMPQILPKRVLRPGDVEEIRGHLMAAGVPRAAPFR